MCIWKELHHKYFTSQETSKGKKKYNADADANVNADADAEMLMPRFPNGHFFNQTRPSIKNIK